MVSTTPAAPAPFLTDYDIYLFSEGSHYRTYEKLGAHVLRAGGKVGTNFALWAPNARRVSVIGDFNGWREGIHTMHPRGTSGIWECFIPELGPGTLYKY